LSKDYKIAIKNLKNSLPFITSVILIEGANSITFATDNWEFKNDVAQLIESWESMKVQDLKISGKKYVLRDFTNDKFVAISLEGEGNIIGVRDGKRVLFAQIESDGIILLAINEMRKLLDAIRKDKLSELSYSLGEKKEKLDFSSEKMDIKQNQNTQSTYNDLLLTARLLAYYRAQELTQENPLIIDPLAELLAGDLSSYLQDHIRLSQNEYTIVRSYYIETFLLDPWCRKQKNSQIVLLGAGLDSRAYRLKCLDSNSHEIFEVDLPNVIEYKENLLKEQTPICDLTRIVVNLSDSNWTPIMIDHGFEPKLPTYWILEGLVYYMEKKDAFSLFAKVAEISSAESQIFVDLMHKSRWVSDIYTVNSNLTDPFSKNIKWGIDIKDVPEFLASANWDVTCEFADNYDYNRNVGQKGMIFVTGKKM
jgi:methyltransferase (TIGR00027 family)